MVHYEAQEKQALFHNSDADEVFYGGAAGGGKSYSIIWDAATFCMSQPNLTAAIFRRTYPELEKSVILKFLEVIPRHWYKYSKKEHRAYFVNGSILDFNYCQFDSDVFKFQSAQYEREYFDELTHFSRFIYTYLQSRCRTTKPNVHPQVKSASNPGNIGHEWVKNRFIKGTIPGEKCDRTDPETNNKYSTIFIPARVYDNKYIMENDPGYINRLMKLDSEDRKGLLDGDWDILKGQYFHEWRYDVHTCDPFPIPKFWTRIRCMDWGYAKPAAVLWLAFSPDGQAYVYRELVVTETTDSKLAGQILGLSTGEHIDYTMADPSMWSVTQMERGESIAMRMINFGINLVKADNNRISGWNVIHSYLQHDLTAEHPIKPKLQVFKSCPYLIETLPALIRDDRKPEDVNTDGDDHGADALRYGLMSKPVLPKKPRRGVSQFSVQYWIDKMAKNRGKAGYVGSY